MADFYIRSARALDRVLRDECSVKAAAAPHADSGRVLAVLINALAYRSALNHALHEARVLQLEPRAFVLAPPAKKSKLDKPTPGRSSTKPGKESKDANGSKDSKRSRDEVQGSREYPSKEALLLVLCHDLLFQTRGIQASKTWPPKVTLDKYRASLHSALVKLQIREGKARIQDLRSGALYHEMTARMPRWIRINRLRATSTQVLAWLADNHYTQVEADEIANVRQFALSKHVDGLLAFHPRATSALLQTELYRDSWIVMQDLASCFPAAILDPPAAAQVIDATSAPGNKTSHLSAIMHSKSIPSTAAQRPTGLIHAFERDAQRYKTLLKRLAAVGALQTRDPSVGGSSGNVVAQRKDFLTTDPDDFAGVTHMLLDPSCSGSGIVNRLDFLKEDDDVETSTTDDDAVEVAESEDGAETKLARRLRQLGEFQLLMIRHAFKFGALERVVYSTCSVHAQENEAVVIRALQTEEARRFGWSLAPRSQVIPSWPVRGDPSACKDNKDVADAVIRCVPGGAGVGDAPHVEACNGFFVACFVRNTSRKRSHHDQEQSQDDDTPSQTAPLDLTPLGTNSAANRKKKLQKRRKKQRLASNPDS